MATIKQKRAAKKILENPSLPISRVMREVGYKENTAVDPGNLTRSKGWEELMEKNLPDKLLAKVHLEGLKATEKKPHLIDRDDKGRPVYEYIKEDDFSTRHKYLDSAYKLKKKYPKEGELSEGNKIQINVIFVDKELAKRYGFTDSYKK